MLMVPFFKVIDYIEKISTIRKCSFALAATDVFGSKISGTFKRCFFFLARTVTVINYKLVSYATDFDIPIINNCKFFLTKMRMRHGVEVSQLCFTSFRTPKVKSHILTNANGENILSSVVYYNS